MNQMENTITSFSSSGRGAISIRYHDFTDDTSTTELVTVVCTTRRFHPENVLWLRNGELLSTESDNYYETVQNLYNRQNSVYENKLIIRDTIGLINNPTYACEVSDGNTTVTTNVTVTIGITGTDINNAGH